jgi:hypothetical protein
VSTFIFNLINHLNLKVKVYFERKYNLNVQKVNFPLMNRLFELWGLTGWTDGVHVKNIYF